MNKDEEHLDVSLAESKKQKKERVNKGINMKRPFTFNEEKILWDGLREDNKTTHDLLMEGFKEEQTLRKIEERQDD